MINRLKALGLALLACLALGGLAAQVASAADAHEFHSDGSWTIGTGKNIGALQLSVGSVGTITCNKVEVEDESASTMVSENTYRSDTLTVTARWLECEFGGQLAVVKPNHCAFVLDSDTTEGNPTGGKHANMELECAEGNKIEVHTSNCTVTISPQVMKHALRYENDTASSVKGILTAHNVVVGKERNTAAQPANGCLLFPTGAVGKLTGTSTSECFRDDTSPWLEGTEKTTPQGLTKEGPTTECSITDI